MNTSPLDSLKSPPTIALTCILRTHNEARIIERVVKTVVSLGAEVIVVDDGSDDDTQAIATQAGAKVIEQAWLGNGHQKRVGEEAAANDWILDLDADEIPDNELKQAITELFANGAPPAPKVYAIKLITVPPVGKPWRHCSLAWRNKLYNKQHHRMPAHAAWDQLELPKDLKPPRLAGALMHHSFDGVELLINKMNRSSTVRAKETKLKPLWLLRLRILFGLPFYLFKKLIFQKMILAGTYGFACAMTVCLNRWLKDVKMYEHRMRDQGK